MGPLFVFRLEEWEEEGTEHAKAHEMQKQHHQGVSYHTGYFAQRCVMFCVASALSSLLVKKLASIRNHNKNDNTVCKTQLHLHTSDSS